MITTRLFGWLGLCTLVLAAGGAARADSDYTGFYVNAEGTPIVQMIQSASQSVDIEIYEMGDPQVIAAIRQALSNNVRVRVIQEPTPVGSKCAVFSSYPGAKEEADCPTLRSLVSEVRASGGSYEPFNKAALCGEKGKSCFEHGKIVLVDGRVALISSGNFNSSNLCDKPAKPDVCNRDYTVVTQDTGVVSSLEQFFGNDLAGSSYDVSGVLNSTGMQSKLTVSPVSLQPIVDFIRSATTSIQLQNQYLEEPTINSALVEMARKGVQVTVEVESVCFYAKPTASEVTKTTATYREFDSAGIQTKMMSRKTIIGGMPGYLHAKAIVVDGNRAWMGSVNGSETSVAKNREYGLFIDQADWVSRLASVMTTDFNDAGAETWQQSLACAKDKKK